MYNTPFKTRVDILGHEIAIKIDDDYLEANEAVGLYVSETIYLKSSYENEREFKTIYTHECIHALCDLLGIQLDHHVEEVLAHRISHMIYHEM